ncbi:MAG: hypothetical protein U0Y82_11110 [Thermoleophilia bacterium]
MTPDDAVTLNDLRAALAADLPRSVVWSMWLRLPFGQMDIGLALIENVQPDPPAVQDAREEQSPRG